MKIAIIAHDGKKTEMVQFLLALKSHLQLVELVARTQLVNMLKKLDLKFTAEKKLDLVIFFRDPLNKHRTNQTYKC